VSAADAYISGDNKNDPVIGEMVKISEHGFVSFCNPDGDNHELNLNWKQLRSMATWLLCSLSTSDSPKL
jgi:hypothetical protein